MPTLIPVEHEPFEARQEGGPVELPEVTVTPEPPRYGDRLAPFLQSPTETAAQQYMGTPRPRYVGNALVDDRGDVSYRAPDGSTRLTDNRIHELQKVEGGYHVYEKMPQPQFETPPYVPPTTSEDPRERAAATLARQIRPTGGRREGGFTWGVEHAPEVAAGMLPRFPEPRYTAWGTPAPPEAYADWGLNTAISLMAPAMRFTPENALGMAGSRKPPIIPPEPPHAGPAQAAPEAAGATLERGPGGGEVGGRSLEEAQRAAAQAAGPRPPLQGLPTTPIVIDDVHGYYTPGPTDVAHTAAESYMREHGLPYNPPKTYAKVDPVRAASIAKAFDDMPHAPNDPQVQAAYRAMVKETLDQWRAIEKTGLDIDFMRPGQPDPYHSSPRLAQKDVQENNHLWVYPTDLGIGENVGAEEAAKALQNSPKYAGNPLFEPSGVTIKGKPLLNNDVFRIVHDYFGHIKDGNGFRAGGEENAWRSHSAMYSPLARRAMTSETRGQNSWVNYGPHGEANRTAKTADTVFAEQKMGTMPDWVMEEGRHDPGPTRTLQPVEHQPEFVGEAPPRPPGMPEPPPQATPILRGNPNIRGSMNTLDNMPFTYKGKSPSEWTPQEFKEVGDAMGVPNLGPESPGKTYKYMDGNETFNIPGGLKGKFTYYDLLKMKADGIDPSRIPRNLHVKIQQKMARTMTPDQPTTSERNWSGITFGMTSPNNPLFPNQLAQSVLRLRDPQLLDQLANSIPWRVGEKVPMPDQLAASNRIANMLGLQGAERGGLGVRGSTNYTGLAELAQLWKQDPDWFRKTTGESWQQFVERLSSQVRGLSMKTGSFGSVWQNPAQAGISAMDRHMISEFERTGQLFRSPEERTAFENRAVARWNNSKPIKENPSRRVSNYDELPEGFVGGMKLEYMGNALEPKYRLASGQINPRLPPHLAQANFPVEPSNVTTMGEAYGRGIAWNERLARQQGLPLFMSQWLEWDRIRRRLEPHENMFPGLEKMPAMSRDQLRGVSEEHTLSGHKNYGKELSESDEVMRLEPTRPRPNPARFAYFTIPPVAALLGIGQDNQK